MKEKATKHRAKVAEVKVAPQAIEDYKKSENLKEEVGEAVYDTYLKEFAKCKVKVSETFSSLDLWDKVAKAEEQQEEEKETETKVAKLVATAGPEAT